MAKPWILKAREFIGEREAAGVGDNPTIVAWYKHTSLPKKYWHDSVPWCSVFVCAMLELSGFKSTRNAMARSHIGKSTPYERVTDPAPGDIFVIPRGKPPSGHVGFVESVDGDYIKTIEGNVADQVTRKTRSRHSCIGFARPFEQLGTRKPSTPAKVKKVVKKTAKSGTVWSLITSAALLVWGYLAEGMDALWGVIVGIVSALPTISGEVAPSIMTSKQFAGWLGVSWPKVGVAIAVALIAVAGIRHIRDKLAAEPDDGDENDAGGQGK